MSTEYDYDSDQNTQPPWNQRKVGLESLFGVGLNRSVMCFDPTSWSVAEPGLKTMAEDAGGMEPEPN